VASAPALVMKAVSTEPSALKGGVHRAVGVEPGDAVASYGVDRGEIATDEHLAVGLHRHGQHLVIHADAGGKAGVHVAGGQVGPGGQGRDQGQQQRQGHALRAGENSSCFHCNTS